MFIDDISWISYITPYYYCSVTEWGMRYINTDTVTIAVSPCFTCGSTLADRRDNQTYNTVQIGTQCWMAQNLNYGTYVVTNNEPQQSGYKFCQNINGESRCYLPYGWIIRVGEYDEYFEYLCYYFCYPDTNIIFTRDL